MAPVLEQAPRRVVGGAVERLAVVRAEAGEAGQVVRPREHVDRVDLDQADAVEQAPDRAPVVPPRLGEALRGQRGAPRLGGGKANARHRLVSAGGPSARAAPARPPASPRRGSTA